MGRDKALLEIDERPLVALALEKLRALGSSPRICGSRADLAAFAPVIPDNVPRCGPLGGIEAALAASDSELNLFLPVDLPRLPLAFLRWLAERAEATDAVATVPQVAGRSQPLCAVYSRRLLPGIRSALASGSYKTIAAIDRAANSLGARIDAFQVESVAAALIPNGWPADPPLHDWFQNINTPADYEILRTGAGKVASGANARDPIS